MEEIHFEKHFLQSEGLPGYLLLTEKQVRDSPKQGRSWETLIAQWNWDQSTAPPLPNYHALSNLCLPPGQISTLNAPVMTPPSESPPGEQLCTGQQIISLSAPLKTPQYEGVGGSADFLICS